MSFTKHVFPVPQSSCLASPEHQSRSISFCAALDILFRIRFSPKDILCPLTDIEKVEFHFQFQFPVYGSDPSKRYY